MRFLLTCIPGLGHFNPLLPLARALEGAGHSLAFVTAPAFAEVVRSAGFEFIPAGLDWDERHLLETLPELRDVEKIYRGEWMMRNIFLERSPRLMIADLLEVITAWRPDMIVAGSFEYGGPIAAEKCGLPFANASYTVRWNRWIRKHALGKSIARLRREFDLPSDPTLSTFDRVLDLCFAPPSWTFEGALLRKGLTRLVRAKVLGSGLPLRQRLWGLKALLLQRIFARSLRAHPQNAAIGPNTHFIGEREKDEQEQALPPPDWLQEMPRQPIVFVSLGTVLGAEYPEVFDTILAALRERPVNLVMTLGATSDPARFGAQPPNVRIVRFMDQDELRQLLPHADLCINHAGYGSIMEALVHGVPLVLLPLVSDAPMNNQMCLSTGLTPELPDELWGLSPKGLPVIRPEKLTSAIIRDAVMQALREPGYKNAAEALRVELAQRPGPQKAVNLLERAQPLARK